MKTIIKADNISKSYGEVNVLSGINIEIKEGELLGIMGSSGSGKSTLLSILSTLEHQDKGDIFVKGKNSREMSNEELSKFRRENIGFIFQNYNLIDTLTNRDNIIAPLILLGVNRKKINEKVEEISEKMDIEELLNKYPVECSEGQKQRIAIARALSNNPKIIIADEPTDSLDVKKAIEVMKLIKKINIEDGIAVILVTHNQFMASYADKIILINNRRIKKEIFREYSEGEEQIEFYKKIISETAREFEEILK
ncbi:ABC transporter ATP-binding protein [uncultured Clostridium sp.]|uniref:ABC transporter ATP-binding protein n=1 Tax=uncultured Clostridium sp. TaxID=59620 RepID=UPI0026087458|nr:ABC transporter ATP-binding protein [uncultured Clostridium sp.]